MTTDDDDRPRSTPGRHIDRIIGLTAPLTIGSGDDCIEIGVAKVTDATVADDGRSVQFTFDAVFNNGSIVSEFHAVDQRFSFGPFDDDVPWRGDY